MDAPLSNQPSAASFQQKPGLAQTIPAPPKHPPTWQPDKVFPEKITPATSFSVKKYRR
jgi:hypothetical protein